MSQALSLEKAKISVSLLVAALFYHLSSKTTVSIPNRSERRERDLQELIRKAKQPVARLVEAHDLHARILTAFKRLAELVTEGGGQLVVILVGHPKLRNGLKRPLMKGNRRPDDCVRVRWPARAISEPVPGYLLEGRGPVR
jgi:type II secretory pathway predicted ATPase ExeA